MTDLVSAGQQWPGGIEWGHADSVYTRHWWRFDSIKQVLVHRSSGETIAYVGELEQPSWHKYEYRHNGTHYPVAIKFSRVVHPNPDPDRYAGPPYNAGRQPELALSVWHVNHQKSADLWLRENGNRDFGSGSQSEPPYWLWKRVDNAIVDAALLWPSIKTSLIPGCDEVAVSGGWLNGNWREKFYRRLRQDEDWRFATAARRSKAALNILRVGLPLTDYELGSTQEASPSWHCVFEPGFDQSGHRTLRRSSMMRDSSTDTFIAEVGRRFIPLLNESLPNLLAFRDGIACAVLVKSSGANVVGSAIHDQGALTPSQSWQVRISGWCSITCHWPEGKVVPWLGKPATSLDSISSANLHVVKYDPRKINHALSSYRSWRWLYDAFLNALPFSPGFDETACKSEGMLGNAGELVIQGGFVGGIQSLITEVRLTLELPTDPPNAGWEKFFH